MPGKQESRRGEVLVAVMPNRADFEIAQNQLWYRVPMDKRPKRWPPDWLAFYQTTAFGQEAVGVKYYARVKEILPVGRRDLFPHEPLNAKSDREYYQIKLEHLLQRDVSIRPRRWRRVVFIPTTWSKFQSAEQINDLFDDSPLENTLWSALKVQNIPAERQWYAELTKSNYILDFAVFCEKGSVDIETDGDRYHISAERAPKDNERNNALAAAGWRVLRYNTDQIRERFTDYCLPNIVRTINDLGGLQDEAIGPRRFYPSDEGIVQQLSLFGSEPDNDLD